ncbi:MAG: C39 family peptidase [Clostridiales bacterium]|nr:C39 family peptidase [Clostridiales bacterium]
MKVPTFVLTILISEIIGTVLIYLLVTGIREGLYKIHRSEKPDKSSYMIQTPNSFEIQGYNQCAGFSSAYLMRHYGRTITGQEAYQKMPKLKNGTVLPRNLLKFLKSEGLKAGYYRGNTDTIKSIVEKGDPVIVLIRSFKGSKTLHYVNIVGYDEDNLYLAETIEDYINADDPGYNRIVRTEDFIELWNTSMFVIPLHKNTFFKIV